MRNIYLVTTLLAFLGSTSLFASAENAAENKTMANLQAAYNGESNANAKYLAYGRKADEEGYHKVAQLFRATASAEEIHLKNHARVIRDMGGTPAAEIKIPEVKSTRENLDDSINGETRENASMYPEYIAQAKKDNNKKAVATLNYANKVEAEHSKLYKAALDNLEQWKSADGVFYVCPTCGFTVEKKPGFADCPVCDTKSEVFLMIS